MKKKFPQDFTQSLTDDQRQQIQEGLTTLASSQRLACKEALKLANELGVPPAAIGQTADKMSIRIVGCQLGCF